MSISGINSHNYSNYYAGRSQRTAGKEGNGSGFQTSISGATSNITLNLSGTEDGERALTAVGFPDGSSASVYKAKDYDPENPTYRVRYWDTEGNYTDTDVNIDEVNPANASYLEMLAYTTYSDVNSLTKDAFGQFMTAAHGVNGDITYDMDSINEKKDFASMVKDFMEQQYQSGNMEGYLKYKELYEYIQDKLAK